MGQHQPTPVLQTMPPTMPSNWVGGPSAPFVPPQPFALPRQSQPSAPQGPASQSSWPTAAQQQQIQSALQNPHQGDQFKRPAPQQGRIQNDSNPQENMMMPFGPAELAAGGAGGIVIAKGLEKLMDVPVTGGHRNRLVQSAKALDNIPGIKQISHWIEGKRQLWVNAAPGSWTNQLWAELPPAEIEKQFIHRYIDAVVAKQKLPAAFLTELENRVRSGKLDQFAQFKTFLDTELQPLIQGETPAVQAKVAAKMQGLLRRFNGFEKYSLPLLKEQYELLAQDLKGVGFVGRFYANTVNYLKRIFGGEAIGLVQSKTAAPAAAPPTSWIGQQFHWVGQQFQRAFQVVETHLPMVADGLKWLKKQAGKYFGPFFAGALVIGTAFADAKKAEKGEKLSAFFHNLFGIGIGGAIGFEIGRKGLEGLGVFSKSIIASGKLAQWLPQFASRFLAGLPSIFARTLPIFSFLSVGGVIVNLLAIFVLSRPFQKAGEWVAHKLFGTPKQVLEEEKRSQGIEPAKILPGIRTGQIGAFQQFQSKQASIPARPGSTSPFHPVKPPVPEHAFSLDPNAIIQNSRRVGIQSASLGHGAPTIAQESAEDEGVIARFFQNKDTGPHKASTSQPVMSNASQGFSISPQDILRSRPPGSQFANDKQRADDLESFKQQIDNL